MSHYVNYDGLDRYIRNGITFLFELDKEKSFLTTAQPGARSPRVIPNSPEAAEARKHLEELSKIKTK